MYMCICVYACVYTIKIKCEFDVWTEEFFSAKTGTLNLMHDSDESVMHFWQNSILKFFFQVLIIYLFFVYPNWHKLLRVNYSDVVRLCINIFPQMYMKLNIPVYI